MSYPPCTARTVQADLRDTLAYAAEYLPHDTHPIHHARLTVIDRMISAATTRPDFAEQWAELVNRAEAATDAGTPPRRLARQS